MARGAQAGANPSALTGTHWDLLSAKFRSSGLAQSQKSSLCPPCPTLPAPAPPKAQFEGETPKSCTFFGVQPSFPLFYSHLSAHEDSEVLCFPGPKEFQSGPFPHQNITF